MSKQQNNISQNCATCQEPKNPASFPSEIPRSLPDAAMSRRKKDAFLKHQEGIHGHIYNSRGFQYTAAAADQHHNPIYQYFILHFSGIGCLIGTFFDIRSFREQQAFLDLSLKL